MGFFDKIKDAFNRIKEENKYLARTTARMNSNNLYGWVNYKTGKMDPNDDFRAGSYVNVEDGKGLIYNTGDEDYLFEPGDITSFDLLGDGHPLPGGKDAAGNQTKILTLRFSVAFKDGKKTTMDINCKKLDTFKAIFKL
ncbi:MAG: hypothetical protein J6S13_07260 [Clostridia bacterium]|nr:hypothetical protein [Clostridia bacterium]